MTGVIEAHNISTFGEERKIWPLFTRAQLEIQLEIELNLGQAEALLNQQLKWFKSFVFCLGV